MLSAGTALASLPRQGVCRRCPQRTVLVGLPLKPAPASSSNASQYASSAQGSIEVYSSSTLSAGSSDTCYSRRTRKATAAFASHEENWFVFSRSHHPPLTRTNEVVDANFCTRTTIANGSKCKTSGGNTRRLLGEKRHR